MKKIIEKAIKNGYSNPYNLHGKMNDVPQAIITDIIFSHDFAKAYFGDDIVMGFKSNMQRWELSLSVMALEKNKVAFLERFL